jgi:hypothetical protein
VLRPLDALDALACTGLAQPRDCAAGAPRSKLPDGRRLRSARARGCLSARWCYAQAATPLPGEALGAWRRHRPAPYIREQISNALFGSARDVSRLARMLANGGALDGVRVLSAESTALLFAAAREAAAAVRLGDEASAPVPAECMGMSGFALGLGWCRPRTAEEAAAGGGGVSTDNCLASDWYGWLGAFGSRWALMPTDEGSLVCVQMANTPHGVGRSGNRLTGRHHAVGMNFTRAMRAVWPMAHGADGGPEAASSCEHVTGADVNEESCVLPR